MLRNKATWMDDITKGRRTGLFFDANVSEGAILEVFWGQEKTVFNKKPVVDSAECCLESSRWWAKSNW